MKYLMTIFLFTLTILAFGQSNVEFGQLINSWTQGKIAENGKVIQADLNRGGWYELIINSDTTAIFRDPFTCGTGQERYGKWKLNKTATTLTFVFSKSVGYMNSHETSDIDETEIYKIKKLTADELILTRTIELKEKIWPFLLTKK